MAYILQIAKNGGAETGYKCENGYAVSFRDTDRQLNRFLKGELQTQNVVRQLEKILSEQKEYNKKLNVLQKAKYKVIIKNVGEHGKGEIHLVDENNNKIDEFAHIEEVYQDVDFILGSMNRLFVSNTKPKSITFINDKLGKKTFDTETDEDDIFCYGQ